jgi:ABC-type multidrug transport system fused ATPase/permease subunit
LHQALASVDFHLLTNGSLSLHTQISDGGVNLSAGTRQLLMLARAMLTDARILVMDEATANCDGETDATMQRAVRANFNHATILTVAHRLDTIIDYDRIFVMEAGAVVEAGTPAKLLATEGSRFGGMCAEAGIDRRRAGGEVTV